MRLKDGLSPRGQAEKVMCYHHCQSCYLSASSFALLLVKENTGQIHEVMNQPYHTPYTFPNSTGVSKAREQYWVPWVLFNHFKIILFLLYLRATVQEIQAGSP